MFDIHSTTISVFISYARINSDIEFVNHLEVDLKKRGLRTWVDRSKLEGGQKWLDEIQKAIERSHVLLIVLSPEAVASQYVKMEYRHAQREKKLVIPLYYRRCSKTPMELNDIQWVNFQSSYEQGLSELVKTLNKHSNFAKSQMPMR